MEISKKIYFKTLIPWQIVMGLLAILMSFYYAYLQVPYITKLFLVIITNIIFQRIANFLTALELYNKYHIDDEDDEN